MHRPHQCEINRNADESPLHQTRGEPCPGEEARLFERACRGPPGEIPDVRPRSVPTSIEREPHASPHRKKEQRQNERESRLHFTLPTRARVRDNQSKRAARDSASGITDHPLCSSRTQGSPCQSGRADHRSIPARPARSALILHGCSADCEDARYQEHHTHTDANRLTCGITALKHEFRTAAH